MIDYGHLRVLEAVAQASRDYRATMVRYIRDQARLLDEGVPVKGLIERTWDGFAAMAEDALDDALTVLAWYEMSAEGGE